MLWVSVHVMYRSMVWGGSNKGNWGKRGMGGVNSRCLLTLPFFRHTCLPLYVDCCLLRHSCVPLYVGSLAHKVSGQWLKKLAIQELIDLVLQYQWPAKLLLCDLLYHVSCSNSVLTCLFPQMTTLFVANISKDVRRNDLEDEFSRYDRSVKIDFKVCHIHIYGGGQRVLFYVFRCLWMYIATRLCHCWLSGCTFQGNYAFAEFRFLEDAEDAIRALDGKQMGDMRLSVQVRGSFILSLVLLVGLLFERRC